MSNITQPQAAWILKNANVLEEWIKGRKIQYQSQTIDEWCTAVVYDNVNVGTKIRLAPIPVKRWAVYNQDADGEFYFVADFPIKDSALKFIDTQNPKMANPVMVMMTGHLSP